MKASEVFVKAGDAGRNAATGEVASALRVEDGRVRVTAPGIYTYADRLDDDWQPLLTAEEWQAQHPLRLRKLGEGEEINGGCSYVMKNRANGDLQTLVVVSGHPARRHDYEYYELPDLTVAQSEPVVDVRTHDHALSAGEVQELYQPNLVGERLTEPPEVGTPVVSFESGAAIIWKWDRSAELVGISLSDRLYRYLGEIPQEPKEPEKPEPPKWLGALRGEGHAWFVTRITQDGTYLMVREDGHLGSLGCEQIHGHYTLAPDIMPPSPELAALFGESEVRNG